MNARIYFTRGNFLKITREWKMIGKRRFYSYFNGLQRTQLLHFTESFLMLKHVLKILECKYCTTVATVFNFRLLKNA